MEPEPSPGTTMGVEEEFLLVDPVTGRTAPAAGAVLQRAGEHRWAGTGGGFHPELPTTQVEAATGVCRTLAGLRAQLRHGRARLAGAARAEGLALLSSGTPPMDGPSPPFTPGDRFARMAAAYGTLLDGYQASGCHVHIGVPGGGDLAVAVVGHLRPWLPALLAITVNSPFARGRDTGHAAHRMLEITRFPGGGVPPWCASAADHDRRVAALVDAGVLVDATMTFWLARPSPHLPTVEVRAADAAATADEAVLQAALTRGLVRTALTSLAAGREADPADPQLCAAALWTAARHGMDGPALDPRTGRTLPAWDLFGLLLELIAPALEDTGDLTEVRDLAAAVRRAGTGADRQRRAARAGLPAAVGELARHTADGTLTGTPEKQGDDQDEWGACERVPQPDDTRTTEEP
ncbi:carboxylate-amine ligase [Spirillospora albida]|uniref:carboxylate-amine ligase n=1 Tax=Spirillospora albida TaxID=58123 RepID=UPI000A056F6E|nr:glutamate--cysteine ligase [Spirillospora albida]